MLRAAGFFSEKPITVDGAQIRPVDFTAKLVFPQWKLPAGEEDFTIMRLNIEGWDGGEKKGIQYDLFDKLDTETGITSMARTTGYTATAVASLMADGLIDMPGVNPPELLGRNSGHLTYILNYLKERGVIYERSEYKW